MTGLQAANFNLLAERFDFARYRTVTDVGGALALLSRLVATRHPHLRFKTFDLPPVRVHAQRAIDVAASPIAFRLSRETSSSIRCPRAMS